jgi:hypothetical protein
LLSNKVNILVGLDDGWLVHKNDAGTWDIANLGAILSAKQLADFGPLGRKTSGRPNWGSSKPQAAQRCVTSTRREWHVRLSSAGDGGASLSSQV